MLSDATIAIGDGIAVARTAVPHPLLGEALAITRAGGVLTWMSVIDWDQPREIPTVAEPARLPNGAGARILNELASRAVAAGVDALVYAGPYPTPALWRAVQRSFRPRRGDEAAFCADLIGRAARLARDAVADVELAPLPHVRVAWPGGDWAEQRDDGYLRVVIDGVSYERAGSVARLVRAEASTWRAEVWFGDALYAPIATLTASGARVDGPLPLPPLASRVLGQQFPPALRDALGELVAELVPPVLAEAARARVAASAIAWADLGARAARREPHGFALHAALWERIAPHGLPRLALAIAEALAPLVTSAVVADLSRVSVPA